MKSLAEKYTEEIHPALLAEFAMANPLEVPKIEKVTLNMGTGYAAGNEKLFDAIASELGNIAGQKPKVTRAKKSIASFKIRQGDPVGLMVTLRGKRMYSFLDKLINIVLPRIRDFRGVNPQSFDHQGNYNMGIREHIVFPEVDYSKIDKVKPLEITIKTTTKDDGVARRLLELSGIPFSKVQ